MNWRIFGTIINPKAAIKKNLVVNTPLGKESFFDEKAIRSACMQYGTPCITTLSAAAAAVSAIRALQREEINVKSLQEYHEPVLNPEV